MVSKITRLLTVGLIIALAVMFIYLNPADITLQYAPNKSLTLMGGVIYLICFTLGLVASLFFWVTYGIKTYFRERSLKSEEKKSKDFYNAMLEARSLQAAKESARAQDKWQRLIKKDPTDIIARIELSRALEASDEKRQALKILDKARTADPTNVEVLLRAAELNLSLGNKTAAVDNLALVLYHEPSAYAAKLARDLSEELGRIQDAFEYNEKFETLNGARDPESTSRLSFFKLQMTRDELSEKDYLKKLRKLVSSDRKPCRESVAALAQLEEDSGNTSEAAEVLIRAAKQLGSRSLWRQAIEFWLGHGDIDRAIAAGKTAIRDAKQDTDKIDATIDVARLTLSVGDAEEALSHLDSVGGFVQQLPTPKTTATHSKKADSNSERIREYLTLRGAAFSSLERHGDEQQIWQQLSIGFSPFGREGSIQKSLPGAQQKQLPAPSGKNGSAPKQQPSPELSTP